MRSWNAYSIVMEKHGEEPHQQSRRRQAGREKCVVKMRSRCNWCRFHVEQEVSLLGV
jgi:hypothetical protein